MASKPQNKVGLSVLIPVPVKRELEQLAKDDNRSLSNLVEILLTQAIASRQAQRAGV